MKVETYKIKGWKEKETGLLIAENEDWILVKHIPVDYVVDGYKLYKKEYIKKRIVKGKEAKITRVLELKETPTDLPKGFKFDTVIELLKWSEKTYGLFEFQDKKEGELFYGKINTVESDFLVIDMIKASGKIEKEYDYDFLLSKIRAIAFETDYFEAIRLLMSDKMRVV
jgi:hypothetical protein